MSLSCAEEGKMSIDSALNTLAELALIACDASYFTNSATDNPRLLSDLDPTHLYFGDALAPLLDTNPSNLPTFLVWAPTLTDGYTVIKEGDDLPSGGKFIAYKN